MSWTSGVSPPAPLPRALLLGLLALGALLSVTVVPGAFTIDDGNYLVNVAAVRRGHVTVANTAGLTPSRELVPFDPGPETRGVTSTPVASTAPPLYAPIALPFSLLGWRGLVGLNTLAYLLTIVMVYRYAQRYATEAATPGLAAAAFALGGFVIEYAQGLWPHALSIALCTAGIMAVGRLIDGGRTSLAAAGGALLAVATGVRYQNAVLLVVAGGAVALWSARRVRATAAYGAAAVVPLAVSAAINHARLGSWNPISKGPGYLQVSVPSGSPASLLEPLTLFWARLVDFSVRPPLVGPAFGWVNYDPVTGGHLIFSETLQKALLQSAPWAVLALIAFALAWMPRIGMPDARRRQLRFLSLLTLALMLTFAFSGRWRHEGASFNQRYLLELMPLAAVAFAWTLDGMRLPAQTILAGGLIGALLAILCLVALPFGTTRLLLILKVPVCLAAALGVAGLLAPSRTGARPWLAGLAGVCIGWALLLHLGDDVAASRRIKAYKQQQTAALREALPDRSALVAYWGSRDAAMPLLLDMDLVVLDAHADEAADAPRLMRELLNDGRRVFILEDGVPAQVLRRLFSGLDVVRMPRHGVSVVELRREPAQR